MRLKDGDEPAGLAAPGGPQDSGDFGRMVAVVVNDRHALDASPYLIAAFGALEPGEPSRQSLERNTELQADGDCTERVLQVVKARH